MKNSNTSEERVISRIKRSKSSVFVRRDFMDIASYAQVGRILRKLIDKGILINLGYGAYARSKQSSVTGAIVTDKPLPEIAKELLNKLGVKIAPSQAEKAYNSGESTQVPTGRVIGVQGRTLTRRIGYNGMYISFEKVP